MTEYTPDFLDWLFRQPVWREWERLMTKDKESDASFHAFTCSHDMKALREEWLMSTERNRFRTD